MPSCYRSQGSDVDKKTKQSQYWRGKTMKKWKIVKRQSDLAGGKQSRMACKTMSAMGLLFWLCLRAQVCVCDCVCVCWESKRKTLKGRACFLLQQPFVKGSVEKGGMCYLKSSTSGPSLPTCSAPALISAWEGRGEAFTEQALASRGLVVRFTETK